MKYYTSSAIKCICINWVVEAVETIITEICLTAIRTRGYAKLKRNVKASPVGSNTVIVKARYLELTGSIIT